MIGKIVRVKVDRPLGSTHPNYPELIYPVNYGYVEGIIAPDGEEQGAYIIGIDKAIDEFVGEVVAIIQRKEDVEEKWVVASKGSQFTAKQIKEAVNFQEKYFQTKIIM